MDPPIEFMQDENQLIYLSDPWRLSPLMAQHFVETVHTHSELHIFCQGLPQFAENRLQNFPHYPDGQINRIYDQGPWAVVDYSSYLGGDISRQFSSVVKGYLEVITSQDLDADALLNSIHGRITASFLHCTVVRQSSEMVTSTLDFLSTHIKHSMVGELDKRSDFLFYFSSFYIYTVLFPSQVGFIFSEPPNNEDSDPTVMAFLQVLYQYQDARGIPDVALREQLGIPDISEELWDFFERRQGNRHRFAVNEDVLPERPALNTAPARQELLPRPAKNVREISTDERRQNDISRVSADALSLV
ncbi:hypothetical protein CPB84DRAFT_1222850 [Gymnopilus junonius]|uniref:Uncharacterized protein n=1 Tax=Gymnopilus junonius TaxID=109634 RepID=A0A9P5NZF1_GYMJU|nr:hypothetical protein CPB84DRAFT_1222850 [Gymnopilus junonius]